MRNLNVESKKRASKISLRGISNSITGENPEGKM
jgi:hypothetical protein